MEESKSSRLLMILAGNFTFETSSRIRPLRYTLVTPCSISNADSGTLGVLDVIIGVEKTAG